MQKKEINISDIALEIYILSLYGFTIKEIKNEQGWNVIKEEKIFGKISLKKTRSANYSKGIQSKYNYYFNIDDGIFKMQGFKSNAEINYRIHREDGFADEVVIGKDKTKINSIIVFIANLGSISIDYNYIVKLVIDNFNGNKDYDYFSYEDIESCEKVELGYSRNKENVFLGKSIQIISDVYHKTCGEVEVVEKEWSNNNNSSNIPSREELIGTIFSVTKEKYNVEISDLLQKLQNTLKANHDVLLYIAQQLNINSPKELQDLFHNITSERVGKTKV